jgi:MmeI, DNA-methyltransferase domain/MmeI, target recognition domain
MFAKMSDGGGLFGTEELDWFNGGLFDSDAALLLTGTEINTLLDVSRLNWALIEPAIFGTLFERGLDPDQRAQLGAHYTDRDAIWGLVEPVILRPLRREYVEMQTQVTKLLLSGRKVTKSTPRDQDPNAVFEAFLDRLRRVRVLDPACGSGNFLIVSLWALKDLEFDAINWGSYALQRPMQVPQIGPEAVLGIEINPYAAELARVTIWIGEIQWMIRHGLGYRRDPILRRLDHIETRDALLDLSDASNPREAEWPAAEFIVGNPPFLGDKLMKGSLGIDYTRVVRQIFAGRLPGQSDLSCYFHEKVRAQIERGSTKRGGLLATQGIRGGANRRVLERVKESGDIFFARSDDRWILSGAQVHISFVAQDDGSERSKHLDGREVALINADLTSGADITSARRLPENAGISFLGSQKAGPFDLTPELAARMLYAPNPDGRANSDVVKRRANGQDLLSGRRFGWIIDFGVDLPREQAALYEVPFEFVFEHVEPTRRNNPRRPYRENWWLHAEPRPGMRAALRRLKRFIATPPLSKHRIFTWVDASVLPDHQLVVIARDDDYTLGVLQSRVHELWTRATGTQLREVESGLRYTPSTTFETFPFPHPSEEQRERVGEAARRLLELRDGWLNPPGLPPDELEKRTLTSLYNQRPAWLASGHESLDAAVLASYGWAADLRDQEILEHLLALNLLRAGAERVA